MKVYIVKSKTGKIHAVHLWPKQAQKQVEKESHLYIEAYEVIK
jgi:hypothetical protein